MSTIPYADVIDRQLLPVDGQDIVTRVRLVIAGDLAGAAPTRQEVVYVWDSRENLRVESYAPDPVTFVHEVPEHATYGSERSFALPSGVNPFLPPEDPRIPEPTVDGPWSNPGLPSAVRDGDPLTYAETTGSPGLARIRYLNESGLTYHGFRLVYEYEENPSVNHPRLSLRYVRRWPDGPGGSGRNRRLWWDLLDLPPTEPDSGQEIYAVVPPDARFRQVNNDEVFASPLESSINLTAFGNQTLRVFAFYPLVLNPDLLEDIARAQIRLPALLPQRVTVRGYVAPDREHTITGWPGGDYTGVVAQHQYDLGRTVIDFEQAGSPVGLPSEAIEAARERRQAIEGTVATANYNLKMGSRR